MEEELRKIIEKYKDNPISFIEDYLDLKLTNTQKLMLKTILSDKNIFWQINRSIYIPFYNPALKYLIINMNEEDS